MTITYPRHIISDFPGWSVDFALVRRQEYSRTAQGKTFVKDMGPPLWVASYQSKTLSPNELDKWRTILESLGDGLFTFYAFKKSRCYPIAHPNGSWPTGNAFDGNGTLLSVQPDNKTVTLGGFPEGLKLSVGDMVSINNRDLHSVQEDITADGVGQLVDFVVTPHIWPDVVTPSPVTIVKPHCIMSVVPGSVRSTTETRGRGTIYFDAMEAR